MVQNYKFGVIKIPCATVLIMMGPVLKFGTIRLCLDTSPDESWLCCVQEHKGLANFFSTPLFSDDIQVRYMGPGDVRVGLQPHLAAMVDPAYRRYS